MRIVIQIDGENVVVKTDRLLPETQTASTVDAGPVPAELLREFGRGRDSESRHVHEQSKKPASSEGKNRSARPEKETSLNPLRAGEAAARHQLAADAYPAEEAESLETTDAGKAPKLPRLRGNEKLPKRSSRKR